MIEMYDSVTWQDIPADARVVAGYIDGRYAWPREAWAKFSRAVKVLITVTGDLRGNAYDIASGDHDGTPADFAAWAHRKQAKGMHGCTAYCERSDLDEVRAVCRGLAYYEWVADWTNEAHEVPGAVAVQYANVGTRYDASMVYSGDWLRVIDAANRPWPLAA